MNLEEVKNIQLEILEAVHVFCSEWNLTYFLTGGTLIGAIRHAGYIPWDDDIDIMMLRDDYETFVNSFNKQNSHFKVHTCFNNKQMKYPFAKISDERTIMIENTNGMMPQIGIAIDLFPIDALPEEQDKIDKIIKKEQRYKSILSIFGMDNKDRGLLKNVIFKATQLLFRTIDLNRMAQKMNNIAMSSGESNSSLCADLVWGYSEKEIMPREIFNKAISAVFEGRERCIPVGYDTFLTNIYGNYMELPPIEKQIAHHNITAYYKE